MLQLSIYSHSTSNAKVHSLQETVLDEARWRQICYDIAVPFWGTAHNKEKKQHRKNHIPHDLYAHVLLPPAFQRMVCFHMSTWVGMCYSSEFTDLEPRLVDITNMSLISKIMLEMAAEKKKFILNLVTNNKTNRNAHPALNKSREKDLRRRKNFDILSI